MIETMTVVQKIDRRQAQRYDAAFDIRFSINGGVDVVSKTLNFTSRSLAIRSDVLAQKGDEISISFGGLPAINGEIVRIFPEGFAVVLSEESLSLMAHTHPNCSQTAFHAAGVAGPVETATSPFIRTHSDISSRVLITSGIGYQPGYNRHFLSIITAEAKPLENVSAIWLHADGVRWTANALNFERRNNRGIVVMALNDWQIYMGAAYGLKISIANEDLKEWSLEIDAAPIADHLDTLSPLKMAVNA